MNDYNLPIIFLIAASVVCAANAQETNDNWHPNTSVLDDAAKHTRPIMRDAASTLAHDLKHFYQLLRDKQWHETYELRAKAFREDVPEADYLAEAINAEKHWGLANYEVLSSDFYKLPGETNLDNAILICKFTELPDYAVNYSTVFWHKEDGVWKCLSAGPRNMDIFRGTRPPIIDWR